MAREKERETGGKEAEERSSGQTGGHNVGEIPRELR